MILTEKLILDSFDIPLYLFFRKIYPTDAEPRVKALANMISINGTRVSVDDLKTKMLNEYNNTSHDVLHVKIGKNINYNVFLT